VLHDGPVPGGLSDDALLEVRARHLAASAAVSSDDTAAELTRWRDAIVAGDPFDELVLWYEHDLFDQLNLDSAPLVARGAARRLAAHGRSSPSTPFRAATISGASAS
jgi:hypothetical protein